MTAATTRSWHRLRRSLLEARFRAGLAVEALATRSHVHRETIRRLEKGTGTTKVETALAYAHAVGLDLAAVPPHLARMTTLDAGDITAVLRAAQAAADGHRLNPVQARKVHDILTKILALAATDG